MADKAKHWLTQPLAAPVPRLNKLRQKNPQIGKWMAERIFKILSAKWEGEMSKSLLRVNNRPRYFAAVG
jgi:hypothetical protein